MATLINIDNTDFDLNSLFNLQYSFDTLKRLIEALAKNHNEMQQKINHIEAYIDKKEDENIKFKNRLNFNVEKTNNNFKQIEEFIEKKEGLEIFGKTENILPFDMSSIFSENEENYFDDQERKKSKSKSKKNLRKSRLKTNSNLEGSDSDREKNLARKDVINNDNSKISENEKHKNINKRFKSMDIDMNSDPSEIINHLMMRVVRIEKNLIECVVVSEEFPEVKSSCENNTKTIHNNSTNIEDIQKKIEDLENNNTKVNEALEQVSIKLSDLNIFEIFKNNTGEGIGDDVSLKMLQAFDTKFTTKFNLVDKRVKSIEEDSFKIKNENINIKNIQDSHTRINQTLKEDLEKLKSNLDKLNEEFLINTNVLDKNLNYTRDELILMINQVSKDLKDYQESEKDNLIYKTDDNLSNQLNNTKNNIDNDVDKKLNKEMAKRIYELEKNFKLLQHKLNLDSVKSEITKIWASMETKISMDEFVQTKDLTNQHDVLLRFLKETVSQMSEDIKIPNDYGWIRKKVESLSNTILNLKSNDDPNIVGGRDSVILTNKYLEISSFTEFQKSYNRELDGMRRDISEMKRYLEDIITALKSKTSDKDLKNLEELLLSKLEEYKLASIRRYADKVDSQKNFKYLDAQIKHIVEVYIKRMDRGDNWLIAKKPVNGYSCASCESYIGDLNDKTSDHVPWNKYPARESNEKSYRVSE